MKNKKEFVSGSLKEIAGVVDRLANHTTINSRNEEENKLDCGFAGLSVAVGIYGRFYDLYGKENMPTEKQWEKMCKVEWYKKAVLQDIKKNGVMRNKGRI